MSIKLRDLIRNVRACKTASEERAVIAKECAMIRTSFKDEDATFRHRNVAKLLFVHMLGYPSHFGQMECLKLIASPRFLDKRVGYLALSLLVEESAEVLTLVTNSLASDLSPGKHVYVQGLALAALGNISNKDMLRDLTSQVLKLMSADNPYVRKKAILCAVQIFRKVPDMVEEFVPVASTLVKEKNHAIKLTATTALLEIATNHPSFLKKVRKVVPQLIQNLKQALMSGYDREYTINSISDPFLQVQALRLLGVLGKDHSSASEAMNDILAQVATNTEGARNTGNAILYECVRTVFTIDGEDGLRILAFNILGRFLQKGDNNIRYVALTMLGKVITADKQAVVKHRDTIVECLRDSDVSIRVRAVDLVFVMLSHDNIEQLSKEILTYMVLAAPDQKKELCSRLSTAATKFSPNKQWHAHTLVSMLCIAGSVAPPSVWEMATVLIGQPESEHFRSQIVHRLFAAVQEDKSQEGLIFAAVWCIGEFGPLLASSCEKYDAEGSFEAVTEAQVLEQLENIRRRHDCSSQCRSMILAAYAKLYIRFSDSKPQLIRLLKTYNTSMDLELQARSCEFSELILDSIDPTWLAQMPVPTDEEMALRRVVADEKSEEGQDDYQGSSSDSDDEGEKKTIPPKETSASSNLLDFDDIFGGSSSSTPPAAPAENNSIDLLADIFGGGTTATPPVAASVPNNGGEDDLLGVFGTTPSPQTPATEQFPTILAFDKDGIQVNLSCQRGPGDKQVIVDALYTNNGAEQATGFVFQAAVPKFISLKMEPPTGNVLPAFSAGNVQQRIQLVNSMQGTKPIAMKVKISYEKNGKQVVEQATVTGFPSGL